MIDKLKHFADINLPQLHGIGLLVEDMIVQQDLSLGSAADRISIEELEQACSQLAAGLRQITSRSLAPVMETIPAVPKSSVSLFLLAANSTGHLPVWLEPQLTKLLVPA